MINTYYYEFDFEEKIRQTKLLDLKVQRIINRLKNVEGVDYWFHVYEVSNWVVINEIILSWVQIFSNTWRLKGLVYILISWFKEGTYFNQISLLSIFFWLK